MSLSAAVIRELIAAGLSGDALVAACERIEMADPVSVDRQAERRRAADRERKARLRNSAESADTASDKEMSPDPYKKTTPPSHPTDVQTPAGSQGEVKAKKRGTRLPRDWKPSAELESYAMEQGVPAECVEREFEDWCSWAWSDSTPKSVKLDWDLAAKTAMRRAADKYRSRQRDPPRQFNRDPYRSPLD